MITAHGQAPHRFILFWRRLGGGSLTFSIVLHLLLAAGAWFLITTSVEREPVVDFLPSGQSVGAVQASEVLQQQSDQRKEKRRAELMKTARIALPHGEVNLPSTDVAAEIFEVGSSDLYQKSMGDTAAKLHLCTDFVTDSAPSPFSRPVPMKSRCSTAERLARLKANGGTPQCEKAVSTALEWLKTRQNADGSWGTSHQGAMTGLALLCYFGRCETPDSPFYGDTTLKGIVRLVELAQQNPYGVFSTNPAAHAASYEHGIGTYALGEMYGLTRLGNQQIPGMRGAFEKGVNLIIQHQLADGGWGYGDSFCYRDTGSGDLSVTGWQFQALKAAKFSGLKIEGLHQATEQAVKFIMSKQTKDGGFGNANRELGYNQWNLTGAGTLGLQTLGSSIHHSSIAKAVTFATKHFEKEPPQWSRNANLYAWYYYTQAFFQNGGDEWKQWNDAVMPELLTHQTRDGSWEEEKANSTVASTSPAGADRDIYRTTLCTLMLEVYFRYLRVGDRDEGSIFRR